MVGPIEDFAIEYSMDTGGKRIPLSELVEFICEYAETNSLNKDDVMMGILLSDRGTT